MEWEVLAPADPSEAIRCLSEGAPGEARVLAGGTDLLLDLESGRLTARRLVSLRKLPWRSLERAGERLRIGSLLPLRDLERSPGLSGELPGLFEAIRAVGSVALRSRATLGGNLVRSAPASDLLPVLLALGAEVGLLGPDGARTIPVEALLGGSRRPALGPAELVASIEIPDAAPSAYAWQRVRPTNDISQVGVAVARPVPGAGWRIAVGGVPPVPTRMPEAERSLTEDRPDESAIRAAAEATAESPLFVSDRRATEPYRRIVVRTLTARAIRRALGTLATSEAP